jgi:hypothetical protein
MTPLEGQILEELNRTLRALGELLGTEVVLPVRHHIDERVGEITAALRSEGRTARDTALGLMQVMFPGDAEPPAQWWRTPLGRACATHSVGLYPDQVKANSAADILGVGPSRVYQLLDSGKLLRHPDGGVTRASVMQRVAHQRS